MSLSAILAFLNRGFLISGAVAMMIDFAREPVGGLFGLVSPLELTGFALLSAMIMGHPLGVLGYITGIVVRYVRTVEAQSRLSLRAKRLVY